MNEHAFIRSLSYIGEDLICEADEINTKRYFAKRNRKQKNINIAIRLCATILIMVIIIPLAQSAYFYFDNVNIGENNAGAPNAGSDSFWGGAPNGNAAHTSAGSTEPPNTAQESENNNGDNTSGETTAVSDNSSSDKTTTPPEVTEPSVVIPGATAPATTYVSSTAPSMNNNKDSLETLPPTSGAPNEGEIIMKNLVKATISIILIFAAVFALTACRSNNSKKMRETKETEVTKPVSINKTVNALELSAGYKRSVSEKDVLDDDAKKVISDFGFSVFKQNITEKGENQLFSPLSALTCLALMSNGTAGMTLAEIETILDCDISDLNEILLAYSSLILREGSPVKLANSIWIKNDGNITVNEKFLQKNADYYDAQVYSAPFDSSTLEDINNWCHNNTNGMIPQILDNIDAEALVYLMNALSFESEWNVKYREENVSTSIFKNYGGGISTVKMLASNEGTYLSSNKATGFLKYYEGSEFCFAALLPNENVDVYDLISSLNGKEWRRIWENKEYASVQVRIPEYSYDSDIDLSPIMQALGVDDMFSETDADFTQLGVSPLGNLYCGLFKQKAFIKVDRMGTKASSVTIGGMAPTSSAAPAKPKEVYLDRPFVYAIVDSATGLPVFIGCVADLS